MIGLIILNLALGACPVGTTMECSLAGCTNAVKTCNGAGYGPCTCKDCVSGTVSACNIAGCAAAQSTCTSGKIGACTCAIQSCDDANPCTTDAVAGSPGSYFCTHAPTPGVACSDGDPCNGVETCNASGACPPGPPPSIND